MEDDEYRTIKASSEEVLFKDRSSKFYGYAFPIANETSVKKYLEILKKQHPTAGHFCYAYKLGFKEPYIFRVNDDGEPNNSAGMPIYGQLEAFNVTNTLIVVIRYFGGTKLGVGGLINAYKNCASLALEHSFIVKRTIKKTFQLKFEYEEMNDVMKIVKEHHLKIISNSSALKCVLVIKVRLRDYENVLQAFNQLYKVECKILTH